MIYFLQVEGVTSNGHPTMGLSKSMGDLSLPLTIPTPVIPLNDCSNGTNADRTTISSPKGKRSTTVKAIVQCHVPDSTSSRPSITSTRGSSVDVNESPSRTLLDMSKSPSRGMSVDLACQSTSSDRLKTGLKMFAGGVCRNFSNSSRHSRRNRGLRREIKGGGDDSSESSCDDMKLIKDTPQLSNENTTSIFGRNTSSRDSFEKFPGSDDAKGLTDFVHTNTEEQSAEMSEDECRYEPKDKGRPKKASKIPTESPEQKIKNEIDSKNDVKVEEDPTEKRTNGDSSNVSS